MHPRNDPLVWLKAIMGIFPIISQLARQYMCIPATSENVFSTAGQIINKRRATLEVITADILIFLHHNYEGAKYIVPIHENYMCLV